MHGKQDKARDSRAREGRAEQGTEEQAKNTRQRGERTEASKTRRNKKQKRTGESKAGENRGKEGKGKGKGEEIIIAVCQEVESVSTLICTHTKGIKGTGREWGTLWLRDEGTEGQRERMS